MKRLLLREKFQDRYKTGKDALRLLKSKDGKNPLKAYELILYIIDHNHEFENGVRNPEIRSVLLKYKNILKLINRNTTYLNIDLDDRKAIEEFLTDEHNLAFAKDLNCLLYPVMYDEKGESIMKRMNEQATLIIDKWTTDEKWESLFESKKLSEQILKKLEVDPEHESYKKLVDMMAPNFGFLPLFVRFRFQNKVPLERLTNLWDLMKQYKQLLSSYKINALQYTDFEKLDDDINRAIMRNENLKFAKSFISNKYKHLITEDTITLFGELRKHVKSHEEVQKYLANKLAAFKTPEMLGDAMKKVIESFAGKWDSETQATKIEMAGGIVVYKTDRFILAKIPSYQVSNKIGSSSWCIARSSYYWRYYVNDMGIQYFLWDFSKSSNDRFAMIGITVTFDGTIRAAHDKFDGWYNTNHLAEEIKRRLLGPNKEDIINAVRNGYKLSTNMLSNNRFDWTKEDILSFISFGNRFRKDFVAKYKITKADIEKVNKYYYKTQTSLFDEIKKGTKSIDDMKEFYSGRKTMDMKKYKNLIENTNDYNHVKKLLNFKFVLNNSVIEKVSKLEKIEDFIKTFREKIIKSTNYSLLINYLFKSNMTLDSVKKLNLPKPSMSVNIAEKGLDFEKVDYFHNENVYYRYYNEGDKPYAQGITYSKRLINKIRKYSFFIKFLIGRQGYNTQFVIDEITRNGEIEKNLQEILDNKYVTANDFYYICNIVTNGGSYRNRVKIDKDTKMRIISWLIAAPNVMNANRIVKEKDGAGNRGTFYNYQRLYVLNTEHLTWDYLLQNKKSVAFFKLIRSNYPKIDPPEITTTAMKDQFIELSIDAVAHNINKILIVSKFAEMIRSLPKAKLIKLLLGIGYKSSPSSLGYGAEKRRDLTRQMKKKTTSK